MYIQISNAPKEKGRDGCRREILTAVTGMYTFSNQLFQNIHFSVSYRPSEVTPMAQAESLIPSTKVNSHKVAVSGKLQARKAGLYTLFFDNTFSR